jgi:4,5-DOPA dioxygenase extradiol
MNLMAKSKTGDTLKNSAMPVLFIGHGTPMNGVENNEFTSKWEEIARTIPKPKAILCVSAHWETWGTLLTGDDKPKTIHDFGGFPESLYKVTYPAKGSKWLADEAKAAIKSIKVECSSEWGLDHGCWVVLKKMFPDADVPVVQLSLDNSKSGPYHYDLAGELMPLRDKGVLIIGSGNIVHNLRAMQLISDDFNAEYGFDWAYEAAYTIKKLIHSNEHKKLADYTSLGSAINLAVPTPEHYLPMIYVLALRRIEDKLEFFNEKIIGGSLSMASFILR